LIAYSKYLGEEAIVHEDWYFQSIHESKIEEEMKNLEHEKKMVNKGRIFNSRGVHYKAISFCTMSILTSIKIILISDLKIRNSKYNSKIKKYISNKKI